MFFQEDIRRRCVPGPGRPATNIADVIDAGGTIYLLGREDPYSSASPLMTAVAEHVLDTALAAAAKSPWGRLCPPMLACLDELPSTAPLPTLRTRMANERALGIAFIWAAQTRAQLTAIFGEQEARTLLGLTNTLVLFGGSKDVAFNQEISDLLGPVRIARTSYQGGKRGGQVHHRRGHPHPHRRRSPPARGTARPRRRRERQTPHRQAHPLHRRQDRARPPHRPGRHPKRIGAAKAGIINPQARTIAALVEARRRGIATPREADPV